MTSSWLPLYWCSNQSKCLSAFDRWLTNICSLTAIEAGVSSLTWVFAPTTPLDEADDEKDQYDKCNGTHQANEPALSGYVYLVDVGWRHTQSIRRVGGEKREEWEHSESQLTYQTICSHPRMLSSSQQLRTNISVFAPKLISRTMSYRGSHL